MKITVTVAEPHRTDIAGVVERMRSAGMDIDEVLEALGMITGSIPDERRTALEALDGVASVDEQMGFQLPPPDEDIQ